MFGGFAYFYWLLPTDENPNYIGRYYFDTKYSDNYIHKNIALKIGAKIITPHKDDKMTELQYGEVTSYGEIWVDLRINEIYIPIRFTVVEEIHVPALIGSNWSKTHIEEIGGHFTYTIFKINHATDLEDYYDFHKKLYAIQPIGKYLKTDPEYKFIEDSNIITTEEEQILGRKGDFHDCNIHIATQPHSSTNTNVQLSFTDEKLFFIEASTPENSVYKFRCLLDTGSSLNLIRPDILHKLGVKELDKYDNITIMGIGNGNTKTKGSINLKLKIGGKIFLVKLHLVENLIVPCILGNEFLQKHVVYIGKNLSHAVFGNNTNERRTNGLKEPSVRNNAFNGMGIQNTCNQAFTDKNEYDQNYEFEFDENNEVQYDFEPPQSKADMMDLNTGMDYDIMEYKDTKMMRGCERYEKLVETINMDHLNIEESNSIKAILNNHKDVFFSEGDRLEHTDTVVHEIETTTNVPIYKRQYRFPESTKKHINEEIKEMYRQGIIKPSKSPWNAPVLCIPKKTLDAEGNKKYRIVVDFRALNLITKPFVYPIPLIDEILDNLGDSVYFSTLDLKSGFYQVPIHPRDAAKTAFSTPLGHFEFTRMPMGLRNSPSTFQKLMNTILYELEDVKAIVYLDDIIIFGKTIEEHNKNLCIVLEALRRHNLKVEPTKCQILKREIKFLGHTVDEKGIRPTTDNISTIREMAVPTTVKGVRSFLGTVNFYGKFIPQIAHTRKPLNNLLKKNTKFVWTEDCQTAFEKLKNFLTSESLLVRPNYKDTFVLTTDASEYAVGAVLSNEKSTDRPIAYASRGLVGAERRYHTIEKELLAIVWAANHFKHYIFNQKFIVYTDHRPLVSLWHLKETSPTLTRLRLKLQGRECDIRYKQGRENIVADFLSRLKPEETTQNNEIVAVVTRQQKRLQEMLNNDPEIEGISEEIEKQDDSEEASIEELEIENSPNDSHLDDLLHINIENNKNLTDSENKVKKLEEEFKNFKIDDMIEFTKLNILKKISNDTNSIKILILNSKTAFKEISTICLLPHGIKDYVKDNIVTIEKEGITGIIIEGKSNSLINSKDFLSKFCKCLTENSKLLSGDKNIHVISFRKIRQVEILEVIQFGAIKLNKEFSLYNATSDRILPKQEEIEEILFEFHDAPLGGHVGAKRMKKRIGTLFTWPNMTRDIDNYVKQCDSCQKNKIWSHNKIPMKITTTSSEPFEKLYMDIVVLPDSDYGNRYGLVMQDDLTRFLVVAPMEDQESNTVARTFVENYICKFGTPLELVTDQGSNFMSEVFKHICRILKIKKINTSAYHPQANLVERSNRELKTYLRQYVSNNPHVWDQHLPYFTFEYNTTVNSSTKYTPFELLYGRMARLPTAVYRANKNEITYDDYCSEMKKIFSNIHYQAKENLIISKEKRKEIYDQKAKEWQPMWGEQVLVETHTTGAGQKLKSYWRGPYEVVDLPSEQTTVIKNGNKLEKIHNNRLRKYND